MASTRSAGSWRGSTSSRNVRRGSRAETTIGAWSSRPSSRATPVARPPAVMTVSTGDSSRISTPNDSAALARSGGEAPLARLGEGQGPELAVVLAHEVVEQDQPRALRVRPDLGPDDARGGKVALEDVRLEVVVEEVRG